MPRINCYLPIKVCVTGQLHDTQLQQLSETLVRAVAARIAFADQEIARSNGGRLQTDSIQIVREDYDPSREEVNNGSYQVPSYQHAGSRVSMSLRQNVSRRPWVIRKAVYFHSRVGKFLSFTEGLNPQPLQLSPSVLYMDIFEELRWAFAWLVEVNEQIELEDLTDILSTRADTLARVRSEDQILAWGIGFGERARRKLIAIDEDGTVSRELQALTRNNWVLFAGMVLPRVDGDDLIKLGTVELVPLPLHALDFIVNDAEFEKRFGVSWNSVLNQFGDQPAELRMLPFVTLRRVHFNALRYLIEPLIINSLEDNSTYFGVLTILNQRRLAWLPSAARAKASPLTNERTLSVDEAWREDWWNSGWHGAFIYAVVNAKGQEEIRPETERANQLLPSETPEELISRFTSGLNLDEDGLGAYLLGLTRRSPALSHYVQAVLDELSDGDRDDVSLGFAEHALETDLDNLAHSPNGRLLLVRLYDELTSGEMGKSEEQVAQKLLEARVRARSVEVVARRIQTARGFIFPYRQPGPTVYNDSPIHAWRLPDGRIKVRLMNRVHSNDTFRNEVRTLPDAVFAGGLILDADEWIRVKLYDEGGTIVQQPAIYLLQISNQGITKTLHSIATVVATVASFGVGGAAAGASWGVRTLVWLDRAAQALSIIGILVNDHRGWIIENFDEAGRSFISAVEVANSVAGIYGIGRLAISTPQLVMNLRNSWRTLKSSRAFAGLEGSDLKRAEEISRNVEHFLTNADEAAATAQREAAAGTGPSTSTPHDTPAPTTGGLSSQTRGGGNFDVVELGAGDLQASLLMARQGGRVTAVDIKEPALAVVGELESLGGRFVKGTSRNIPSGSADHVVQYFPWRISGTGRYAAPGGTWEVMDEAMRITRPGGVVTFVTESEETAIYLMQQSREFSNVGRTALIKSTAREAAPGATGSGVVPSQTPIPPSHPVWHLNVYIK